MPQMTLEQKLTYQELYIKELTQRITKLENNLREVNKGANTSTFNSSDETISVSEVTAEIQDIKSTINTIANEQYNLKQEMQYFKDTLADNIVTAIKESIFTEKKFLKYEQMLEDRLKTLINEYTYKAQKEIDTIHSDLEQYKLEINKTFVPATEIESIATKDDMKNLTAFIHERYSSIMSQVDDCNRQLMDSVKKTDVDSYVNSIKEWIMKEYKLSEYVSTKNLLKELAKYETKLEASLTKDTILASIKRYNLDDYVTKDALAIALNITPQDLKSTDRISNLLRDFTTESDVREIVEMLYSRVKTDLENLTATMVSKDTYVKFTNEMSKEHNSVSTIIENNDKLISDYIHKSDDLLVVYNSLTKDMANIYNVINNVKSDYTEEVINLINAKVNEINSIQNNKIMTYGNELASIHNYISDLEPTVVVNIK